MARPRLTSLSGRAYASTLVGKLQNTVDAARNIATTMGVRPYLVRILHVRWTGPIRGAGTPTLLREVELLPVPKVENLDALDGELTSVGRVEMGTVRVTGISGHYTEEDLQGWTSDGAPPEPNEEVQWEIEFPRPDGPARKRRFSLESVPVWRPGKLSWEVELYAAQESRDRQGDLP